MSEESEQEGPRIIELYDDKQQGGRWQIVRMPAHLNPFGMTPAEMMAHGVLVDSGLVFQQTAKVRMPNGEVHLVPILSPDRPANIPEDWQRDE